MGPLTGTDTVVVGAAVGAGRGFARGVAVALAEAGATVVGVAGDTEALTTTADHDGRPRRHRPETRAPPPTRSRPRRYPSPTARPCSSSSRAPNRRAGRSTT